MYVPLGFKRKGLHVWEILGHCRTKSSKRFVGVEKVIYVKLIFIGFFTA
jgi:hypothetical protein